MQDTKKKAFIRWQRYTLQQVSFVNNLIIGLSTGILVLLLNMAPDKTNKYFFDEEALFFFAIVSVFLSLVFGIITAWTRLQSFRKTA
jgi:cytochrome c biogenesis protein CcdA